MDLLLRLHAEQFEEREIIQAVIHDLCRGQGDLAEEDLMVEQMEGGVALLEAATKPVLGEWGGDAVGLPRGDADSVHRVDRDGPAPACGLFEKERAWAARWLLRHFEQAGQRAAGKNVAPEGDQSKQHGLSP